MKRLKSHPAKKTEPFDAVRVARRKAEKALEQIDMLPPGALAYDMSSIVQLLAEIRDLLKAQQQPHLTFRPPQPWSKADQEAAKTTIKPPETGQANV